MNVINFTVPGPPVGKATARTVTNKGRTHSFTPAKTVNYQALVRLAFTNAYPGFDPIDGPIVLDIRAYFPAPKYLLKKYPKEVALEIVRHTNKPDMSNIFKAVEDALKGVYYVDDSRISDYGGAAKRYSLRPRLEVWASPADLIESF